MTESGPSHVELATLLVPASALDAGIIAPADGDADNHVVTLQVSHETREDVLGSTTSLRHGDTATGSTPTGGTGTTGTCIQAVVDLTKLSELVDVTEDEFVVGLHREANELPFSPDSGEGGGDDLSLGSAAVGGGGLSLRSATVGGDEETPLLPSHRRQATSDVTLGVSPFEEALADVLPPAAAAAEDASKDRLETPATTTTSEDDAELGHDAFLLEVPQQSGEADHHYVLAMPEIQATHEDVSIMSRESFLPRLEKAFSMLPTHLPTDIQDVQLEATSVPVAAAKKDGFPIATELHLDLVVKRKVPFIGYAILITGLVALSSVGTALELQGDIVTPSMKTIWRLTATALALLPFALHSLRRDGLPKLSRKQWAYFPLAAFSYGYMTTAFVVALSMTSLANSFVLSNLTSLVIIAGKAVMGLPILLTEGLGATIGFTGAAICAKDPSSMHSGAVDHPHALLGDLIALSASFGMAAYLVIAKDLRPKCDIFLFMFVIMTLAAVFVLAFMVASGERIMLSNDPDYGLWGWINLSADRLPLELYMVYVCNIMGTVGYIAVLKYFDSVVVATVMLMEPVLAAFIGFGAGVDPLPGIQTWIGDVIVTIGSVLVIFSGARKTESIDATEAMRQRTGTLDVSTNTHIEMMKTPVFTNDPARRRMGSDSKL